MIETDKVEQVSKLKSKDKESIEDLSYGHNSDILYSVGANGMISVWQWRVCDKDNDFSVKLMLMIQ